MLFAKHFRLDLRLQIAIAFILASFALVIFGYDRAVAEYLRGLGVAGAAFAGAFYTLGATTPFAMVVILEQMQMGNPQQVALVACLSATFVDCALFWAVRKTLEKNSRALLQRLRDRFERFSYAFPIGGFFVFGLPLPDELGLALMEMTTIDLAKLAAVIFLAKLITLVMLYEAFAA
ncbi:MAG: hypothetical protein N3E51_01185 [Candidatus Micrarchaeota archaeon]|nr:hypothetical protein [Candidatus Micrarchaeota archaeon]